MTLQRRHFLACTGAALAAPVFAQGSAFTVSIRDFLFELPKSELHSTDKITFINHDLAPHTATADDGSWDTGVLESGDSITLTIGPDWTGPFHCALHPAMTGTLQINPL
ncbi:copper-binding protein [Roseovarius sp. EL26]|uniref:copper-binding protein n=1 Tax=Roseovarius sp. EL26 TaxID=2126672 RepID=UPI000EA202BE|nr:copper-binding protein [Roseovarius sp. EL26]